MSAVSSAGAAIDVIHPSGERTRIPIDPLPFRIGRGPDNHLILHDGRASRAHAQIMKENGSLAIEDLDSLHGTWVNGERIEKSTTLKPGDAVHFGFADSYRLIISDTDGRIHRVLDQISSASSQPAGAAGSFARLRALVDVARALQSPLASDEVLAAVLDAALALTHAERGFLLLRSEDELEMKIGQDASGNPLTAADFKAPDALLQEMLNERHDMLSISFAGERWTAELDYPHVICVPLVQFRAASAQATVSLSSQTSTIGLLYLDSRQRQTTISEFSRELLHTLALEASSVLENAKLLEKEREQRMLEQELAFARKVQLSLLPQQLPNTEWFCAVGSSLAAAGVSGDYYDVHPIGSDTWAAVIADVSGKGISSGILASLLQGALLLGSELAAPVDQLMTKINHFLIERAQREKYATLFYARVHRDGAAEWLNAGHALPFLVKANGEVHRFQSTGAPVGLLRDPKFEIEHLQLTPGDKIVAYSDGLPEAANLKGEFFESKLEAALARLAPRSAQEIHDGLVDEVELFRDGAPLRDDITLLVLEYRAE